MKFEKPKRISLEDWNNLSAEKKQNRDEKLERWKLWKEGTKLPKTNPSIVRISIDTPRNKYALVCLSCLKREVYTSKFGEKTEAVRRLLKRCECEEVKE